MVDLFKMPSDPCRIFFLMAPFLSCQWAFPYPYYALGLVCVNDVVLVRATYTKIHFIVMDVYFILIKLCYFISMRIHMSYVCI